jgi:hypothetical protein
VFRKSTLYESLFTTFADVLVQMLIDQQRWGGLLGMSNRVNWAVDIINETEKSCRYSLGVFGKGTSCTLSGNNGEGGNHQDKSLRAVSLEDSYYEG